MKIAFKQNLLRVLAVVAALLAVTGCKTVSVSSTQYIGGPVYAPSNPAQIQILQSWPSRANARLGEITAEPSGDNVPVPQIEAKLREAAAKLGADAVVIVSDHQQVTGAIVTGTWYARTVQTTTSRVIVGVAIKYQ